MMLGIPGELIDVLRCPATNQKLHVATVEEFAVIKELHGEWQGALVTEDGVIAYPIEDGFPVLLLDRLWRKP